MKISETHLLATTTLLLHLSHHFVHATPLGGLYSPTHHQAALPPSSATAVVYPPTIIYHSSAVAAEKRAPIAAADASLSEQDRADLQYLRQLTRGKRAGSGDILAHLKSSIGQGIKAKLGNLAQGSASVFSHLSGSGHSTHYLPLDEHHPIHPTHFSGDKGFDLWGLKKSIVFTILQAAKAIKGVIIAGKGHLIKGGGYLISGGGRLISAKGEALTHIGKHIAASALLSPHAHKPATIIEYSSGPPHHADYTGPSGPPSGHGGGPPHHSPPGHLSHGHLPPHSHHHRPHHDSDYISSPSAPGPGAAIIAYHHGPSSYVPNKYYSPDEAKHHHHSSGKPAIYYHHPSAHAPHASGLVIIKKIPHGHTATHHHHHHSTHHEQHDDHHHEDYDEHGGHDHHHDSAHEHDPNESKVPDFKPLTPSMMGGSGSVLPGIKDVVSSVFSASSAHQSDDHAHDNTDAHAHAQEYDSSPHSYQHINDEHSNFQESQSIHNQVKVAEPSPPSTNYGSPVGPTLNYKDILFSNKVKNQSPLESTPMFVTPLDDVNSNSILYPLPTAPTTPAHYEDNGPFKIEVLDPTQSSLNSLSTLATTHAQHSLQQQQPHIYIGMNLPLDGLGGGLQYAPNPTDYAAAFFPHQLGQPISANPYLVQPQQYQHLQQLQQDPRNVRAATAALLKSTAQAHYAATTTKKGGAKKSPTIDIVRSVAFELGPNGPVKIH